MNDDGDGKVIELKRSVISELLDDDARTELSPSLKEFMAKPEAKPREAAPPPDPRRTVEPEAEAIPLEKLPPLPTAATPYEKAHSLIANQPVPTLYFLGEDQLPDGLSNYGLERVRMVDPGQPGGGPELLLRFSGSVVTEVRIEGRDLLALCDLIGRHLIHWVRQHPKGKEADDGRAGAFIYRITPSVIAR